MSQQGNEALPGLLSGRVLFGRDDFPDLTIFSGRSLSGVGEHVDLSGVVMAEAYDHPGDGPCRRFGTGDDVHAPSSLAFPNAAVEAVFFAGPALGPVGKEVDPFKSGDGLASVDVPPGYADPVSGRLAESVVMGVGDDRRNKALGRRSDLESGGFAGFLLVEGRVALIARPPEVSGGKKIDLLETILTHIGYDDITVLRVYRHAPWITDAPGVDFLQAAVLALERISIGNCVGVS